MVGLLVHLVAFPSGKYFFMSHCHFVKNVFKHANKSFTILQKSLVELTDLKNQALHLQYTRKILMILLTDAGKEKHMTMLI